MRRHIYYTLQSLLHKQGSNAIKIVSLALGLLMSVFLFARIAFELSFDNFYHDSDNLYIVKTGWLKNGVLEGNESRFTIIPIPAAIAEEFPEQVESSTVSCSLFDNSFQLGERQLDMSTVMADTLYFSVLGLEMIEGNPQDLAGPDVVFLSAKSAKEAFGDENPIGKTLRYDFWGYQTTLLVKGIFADIPLNTSLERRPEAIISFPTIGRHLKWDLGWQSGGNYDGYLRLRSPQDADWLNERMSIAIARHIPPESGLELSVRIVPIHNLHVETPQVRKMIWIMFFLGIVLLFTTALNYVLVSVASLTQRAKAIGVHKCSGASGSSIFSMFMVETAIVVGLALLLIGLLVYIFHEKMEELAAVPLSALFDWQNLWAPLSVILLLFILGGCLPAMLFARIPVTQVFRRYTSGREGNYTNFPGFYGMLMRNCYTFPLSSNRDTMKKFLSSMDTVLQHGDFMLVYPEQSMWWNYRKPKPLKKGAYTFAAKNHVPVLPCFITMEDSDILGDDGFYVQEYTIHIAEPIYPDPQKTQAENVDEMRQKNAAVWKQIYEEFYGIPLVYDTAEAVQYVGKPTNIA